jgi:saccharopine dehydrogenase-like NADP-dependent oxidoreductase
MRLAVIGGAGGMGSVTVKDAARSPGVEEVRIVDRDEERAREIAVGIGLDSVRVAKAGEFTDAIRGCDAVVNAASHTLNVPVMRACLEV